RTIATRCRVKKKKIVGGSTAMISSFALSNSLLMVARHETSRTMRHIAATTQVTSRQHDVRRVQRLSFESQIPVLLAELTEGGLQRGAGDRNHSCVRRVHSQNQENGAGNRQRGDE